jgi:hypothetical protein
MTRRILLIAAYPHEEVENALNVPGWVTVKVKDFWQAVLRIKAESFSAVLLLAGSEMLMTAAILLRGANANLPILYVPDHGRAAEGSHFREIIGKTIPNLRVVEAQGLQSFLQSI